MSDSDLVRYSRDGRVADVVLNRPDKLNAISDDMVVALRARLNEFDDDSEAWVAILRGEGRAFSSGADVRQRQLRPKDELKRFGGPQARGTSASYLMYEAVNWKPIIAATHGYVLGAALGWALCSDLVIAEAGTKFQITETGRGISGSRLWAMIADRAGSTFADDVALTGRFFTAEEAHEQGLIQHLAEQGKGLDVAREQAEIIASNPPLAVRLIVRARRLRLERLDREWTEFGKPYKLHLSKDFERSARAFAEGTKPVYTGE